MEMNQAIIMGRITRDLEIKPTPIDVEPVSDPPADDFAAVMKG